MPKLLEVRVNAVRSCILFGIAAVVSISQAQVSVQGNQRAEDLGKTVYGLGVAVGPASGVGISFRDHLPSKMSFQIVGGIIKSGDKTSSTIGGEFQYDLVRTAKTRLFFGPSVSYFYSGSGENTYAGPFRAGMGVGAEFSAAASVNLSFEGVFVYFSNGDIAPLPQISCHYYFY